MIGMMMMMAMVDAKLFEVSKVLCVTWQLFAYLDNQAAGEIVDRHNPPRDAACCLAW